MKRYAPVVLWIALAVQASWVILNSVTLHRSPGLDVLGVIIVVTLVMFAGLHQRRRWRGLAVILRCLMAADFLLAVGDRFGVLGQPGAPGVTWGDFPHFVHYTRSMTTFLPGDLAPTLAVLATIAEIALATALLLGVRLQLTALAAAILLGIYGTSMMISLPAAEQFHYNVFVLGAGMLTLATLDRSPLTMDAVLGRFRSTPRGSMTVRETRTTAPRPTRHDGVRGRGVAIPARRADAGRRSAARSAPGRAPEAS